MNKYLHARDYDYEYVWLLLNMHYHYDRFYVQLNFA